MPVADLRGRPPSYGPKCSQFHVVFRKIWQSSRSAFEFESEWLKGNSATKQSPNYHLSDFDKVSQTAEWQLPDKTVAKLPFGCLTDFSKSDEWQFGDCFVSSVQTQIQTQTEPEACTMHILNY